MRYFVFLRIKEKAISDLLNIAIYTLNPMEKWGAHVTLAGPYSSRRNLPRARRFEAKVSVIGASRFRSDVQNTVYLKVGADALHSVWDKPDFPFNPHMTIYDGRDDLLGDRLYDQLSTIRPFLFFHTSILEVVRSPKNEPQLPMLPFSQFPPEYNFPISSFEEAWGLSRNDKIDLAVSAIKKAKDMNLFGQPTSMRA